MRCRSTTSRRCWSRSSWRSTGTRRQWRGSTRPPARARNSSGCGASVLAPILAQPTTWTLRDYHSPNLHWLEDRSGLQRLGLIDFQDAVLGPPAYDLASLLQDARVDVPDDLELRLLAALRAPARRRRRRLRRRGFAASYAVMGAQRATKILGIFARLDKRDGKPQYLKHLPRIERRLAQEPRPSLARAAQALVSGAPAARARRRRRSPLRAPTKCLRRRPRPPWCSPPGWASACGRSPTRSPKPLVKVAGRALIDHCLDRFAAAGVARAIVNVHWLADQIEAHLATRKAPKIVISDERANLLDQGGGDQARAAADRRRAVLPLQHRRVLDRGAALEPAPPRRGLRPANDGRDPDGGGGRRRGRRRLAGRFHHGPRRAAHGARAAPCRAVRLHRRRHHQAATVRRRRRGRRSASRRSSFAPPSRAASTACASTACGCTSAGPRSIAEAEQAIDRSRL